MIYGVNVDQANILYLLRGTKTMSTIGIMTITSLSADMHRPLPMIQAFRDEAKPTMSYFSAVITRSDVVCHPGDLGDLR
jgi:hypothetical protein